MAYLSSKDLKKHAAYLNLREKKEEKTSATLSVLLVLKIKHTTKF